MGVNITTIVYLRVLIIQIGSTIILMVVEAQGKCFLFIPYISSFFPHKNEQNTSKSPNRKRGRWLTVCFFANKKNRKFLGISNNGLGIRSDRKLHERGFRVAATLGLWKQGGMPKQRSPGGTEGARPRFPQRNGRPY